jgi:fatty acid desaturase
VHFVVFPAVFLPFGVEAALAALANSVLAELLVNAHAFLVIVPNHAGPDLLRFDTPARGKAAFAWRQIRGSANFRTGGAVNDFLHGYLNYQVEHHLWPDASPLLYQMAAPHLREICARHGVPYLQESVWVRLRKMVAIAVGTASMPRSHTLSKSERRGAVGESQPVLESA